jgi:guanylate kinase
VSTRRGIPFVLSAPSGAGKTTVCRALVSRDPGLVLSVSHTTRAPRQSERDGVAYHFVTPERFRALVEAGAFVEYAEYGGRLYGTSWEALEGPRGRGLDVLLEIEIQGARQVRARLPEARLLFLLPPSLAELERRLRGRGTDPPDVIERRLAIAHQELDAAPEYDYAVMNDDLEGCIAAVLEIIAAERRGETAASRRRFDPHSALAKLMAPPRAADPSL